MRILLIALGSAGDVHPLVGLGLALAQRGHDVTVATNPHFAPLILQTGLKFAAVGTAEELRQAMENPDLWDPQRGFPMLVEQLLLAMLQPLYDLVADYYQAGEAVVVAPATAMGARVAQEKLGVPLVTIHLQPSLIRSIYRSPVIGPLLLADWVPRSLKHFQFWLTDKLLIDRLVNRGLTPFRAKYGLPPIKHVMDQWWMSPDKVLGLFPDWFGPPQPDWPRQVVLTGFPLWDERGYSAIPADLESFLAAGTPPIVFTPGSAMLHGQEFFKAAVEACQRLGRRGILLTRYSEQLPNKLPDEVRHFEFVPLGSLLPRAAAIVHHAGVGTLAQGLAAGVPHLAMPMSFDQPDNADRLRRLGVGLAVRRQEFVGPRVAQALDTLLSSPEVASRARALAARFDTPAVLERTCHEIELVGTSHRKPERQSVSN